MLNWWTWSYLLQDADGVLTDSQTKNDAPSKPIDETPEYLKGALKVWGSNCSYSSIFSLSSQDDIRCQLLEIPHNVHYRNRCLDKFAFIYKPPVMQIFLWISLNSFLLNFAACSKPVISQCHFTFLIFAFPKVVSHCFFTIFLKLVMFLFYISILVAIFSALSVWYRSDVL